MKRVTFARDYPHPIDALTAALYRAGRSYTVTPDVEEAARAAGALKEKPRGSRRRGGESGSGAPES